jgi:hypothetical protein
LGSKKTDHGELSLDNPAIDKLSDPIHYLKNYKSELYLLVNAPTKISERCKANVMRLSRGNPAYMCSQHKPGSPDSTFNFFEVAGKASFEHYWNNHQFCGDWCQAKLWNKDQRRSIRTSIGTRTRTRKNTNKSYRYMQNFYIPATTKLNKYMV